MIILLSILTIGDSHTSGYPAFDPSYGGEEKSSYQYWLQLSLETYLPNEEIIIINKGIPGDTLDNIITRMNSILKNNAENQFDYVILNGGANDILGLNREINKTFSHLEKLISTSQYFNVQKIIFSSIPATSNKNFNLELKKFSSLLVNELKRNNLYLFSDFHSLLSNENGLLKKDFNVGDGIHLTIDGYKKIGQDLAEIIIKEEKK